MTTVFEDLKVIDFTNNAAGPVAAAMFADFGAEVIKIERPKYGDDTRSFPPFVEGEGAAFWWHNRGKKSVVVALDDPAGEEIVKKIIADMDVLVESFRPGVMKRFGLDYETVKKINPQIVYLSVSTFGQEGPYAELPGYDMIAQGMSGLVDGTGQPDGPAQKIGTILGDYVGALVGYSGALTALYHQKMTGQGQHVDVALLDGLIYMNDNVERVGLGDDPSRVGNLNMSLSPYGIYNGSHGNSAVICAPTDRFWAILTNLMGKPEYAKDERFNSASNRVRHNYEVRDTIESWLATFDDIKDAVTLMTDVGIPSTHIARTKELTTNPQVLYRGSLTSMKAPKNIKGMTKMPVTRNVPFILKETPGEMKQPPYLGEHTKEIFKRYFVDQATGELLQQKWSN